ncbi:alpha/beta hydrolase [Oceanobacillus luteolus]|uniref:Alpha/beta hydrolase n=1 Tax=Oceanobacillus luteolus TaxID=1274358 RepID=A0ABW4HUC9_9BACI
MKWVKTMIDVIGFPFTLTNLYLNRKNKVKEIGQKVRIKDRNIHVVVSGIEDAEFSVILDAGLSCCSLDWYHIQPELSKFTKVLSFDRAGYGWSSRSNLPYTSEDVVDDLIYVLDELELKPPYVLVGHSFGGLNMRLFASKFPEKVTSLILIDAVHENRYMSDVWDTNRKKSYRKNLNLFRFGYITSGIGIPKLLKQPVGRKYLPEPYQKYADYVGYLPKSYEAVYKEFLYSERSALLVKNAVKLREDLPAIVISSNNQDPTWVEYQNQLSRLTKKTIQIKTNNNHFIHLENPDLIIDTIKGIVCNQN